MIIFKGQEYNGVFFHGDRIFNLNPPVRVSIYTPFYIEDISGSENTVQILKNNTDVQTLTIEKSMDGITWESMGSTSTTAITATIPANGKLCLRCNTDKWALNESMYTKINTTGNCNVGGNIMSLLYGSNFNGQTALPTGSRSYCNFVGLFICNTHIVSASDLLLPSTSLRQDCYYNMFWGCTSLTTAPELPATTLTSFCYSGMFYNCSSLNYIKCLATNISASNCTNSWVNGVAASGTFVKNPNMTSWPTSTKGIPSGWTVEDAA